MAASSFQAFCVCLVKSKARLEPKQIITSSKNNIAGLQDAFLSFGGNLYLISQHQGMTLDQCLASSTLQQYARVFFYQLLRGLKYLHSANIVHCDLKPSSILITRGCDLQITGLDHSRIHGERVTIDHVYDNANQCYQAPELMLDAQTYHPAMDMWAAGCVLAEMINGCPLFSEERCTNQLYAIIKLLGYAPGDLMDGLSSGNSLPARDWKPLRKHISTSDNEALDLLEQLLDFDPAIRYPATQALEHVYVSLYYDLADELTSDKTWSVADLDYAEWPVNDWKTLMYVMRIHHRPVQPPIMTSLPAFPCPLPPGHVLNTPHRFPCMALSSIYEKMADFANGLVREIRPLLSLDSLSEIVDHHELRNGRQQPAECSN
ncbi:mitogen-activated protein kinase [Histoplasma capsulatum G186AR]|uniref:Mitogen-activated protein kinase n=1 Tax=Ajellomyces capsulatus (strain G186AR / H82 / ATCC MYA-2454 / RMSCC 2432) TaxID=447093 RepID=C0NQC3_AJECG|nr:mitogen-activated protein kinase [Histoplasma capsulatum G186AR]EEH06395.1 mitogen-activated protein kinase [Histoplasma capsulatum G186AR]